MDTREAPIVLTLQERATGEAVYLQGNAVLALSEVWCDVEFRGQVRVFRVTYALSVDPQVVAVAHAVEAYVDITSLPFRWHGKGTAIGAHGVGHVAIVGKPTGTLLHDAEGGLVK